LAVQFAPEQKFFGLQAKGLDGMAPAETDLETMAADYVASLRNEQPKGPYLIAGYCFGSWVAVEMARLLQKQGEKIDALLLIDPDLPPGMAPGQSRFTGSRFGTIVKKLRLATPRSVMCAAQNRLRRSGSKLRIRLLIWATHLQPFRRRLLRNPVDAISVMSIGYRPRPYNGNAIVLIPANKTLKSQQSEVWERYIQGNIQYKYLAGTGSKLLRQPFVRDLAAHLLKWTKRLS